MTYPAYPTRQAPVALLLALTLSLGLFACTSTSGAVDDAQQAQTITVRDAEDLLQTEDILLAMRVRFGGELPNMIRGLGNSPDLQVVAAMLEDPITTLLLQPGVQLDLRALDTTQPLYISFSSLGNDDFLRAASLGLPTRDEEWPVFILNRVLLPTDDPNALASQFEELFIKHNDENPDDPVVARMFEGPGFLRAEIAMPLNARRFPEGDRQTFANAWLHSIDLENLAPPSASQFRPTAAYNAFVGAESEVALWTRMEALARFGILESSTGESVNAGPYEGKDGEARYGLENLSHLAVNSVVHDPVSAENEDMSLHLDATEAGELVVDVLLTRTSQGARASEAARAGVTLPQIPGSHFLALDWSIDLAEMANITIAPFWEREVPEPTASGPDDFNPKGMFERLTTAETVVAMLTALSQYPLALMTTAAFTEQGVPLARAGTLRAFALPQGSPFPAGMAAALVIDDKPGVRDQLQELMSAAQSALPMGLETTFFDRDDGLIELRIALGLPLFEVFDGVAEAVISKTHFDLNLNKLGQLRGLLPGDTGLGQLDRITIASYDADTYQSFRIGINVVGETRARQAESDAPLLVAPTSRCRTELAAAAFTHLDDLSVDGPARAARYLETFSQRAERCIDADDPYAAEVEARLNMAREWAAELEERAPDPMY